MDNRRGHHLGNFVHKILIALTSSLLKKKFVARPVIHAGKIRNGNQFTIPHHQTVLFRRSFKFNINKFKYKYKSYLFSKQ